MAKIRNIISLRLLNGSKYSLLIPYRQVVLRKQNVLCFFQYSECLAKSERWRDMSGGNTDPCIEFFSRSSSLPKFSILSFIPSSSNEFVLLYSEFQHSLITMNHQRQPEFSSSTSGCMKRYNHFEELFGSF